MFIISLTYQKPLNIIDLYLSDHVKYLKAQYNAGIFLASGHKIPRTGGVILANVDSKADLMDILGKDPFYQNKAADYEVIEFSPSMTCPEMDFLKQA